MLLFYFSLLLLFPLQEVRKFIIFCGDGENLSLKEMDCGLELRALIYSRFGSIRHSKYLFGFVCGMMETKASPKTPLEIKSVAISEPSLRAISSEDPKMFFDCHARIIKQTHHWKPFSILDSHTWCSRHFRACNNSLHCSHLDMWCFMVLDGNFAIECWRVQTQKLCTRTHENGTFASDVMLSRWGEG